MLKDVTRHKYMFYLKSNIKTSNIQFGYIKFQIKMQYVSHSKKKKKNHKNEDEMDALYKIFTQIEHQKCTIVGNLYDLGNHVFTYLYLCMCVCGVVYIFLTVDSCFRAYRDARLNEGLDYFKISYLKFLFILSVVSAKSHQSLPCLIEHQHTFTLLMNIWGK